MLIYVFNAHQGVLNRQLTNEKYHPPPPYSATKLSRWERNKVSNMNSFGVLEPVADPRSAFPCSGGESQALSRLKHYFWDTVSTCLFAHM